MKLKYAKMPPLPKTEEDRLRLRMMELEMKESKGRKSSKSSKLKVPSSP